MLLSDMDEDFGVKYDLPKPMVDEFADVKNGLPLPLDKAKKILTENCRV